MSVGQSLKIFVAGMRKLVTVLEIAEKELDLVFRIVKTVRLVPMNFTRR